QREVGIAFLFVTHDQDEAMALSDRIALLRNGALEQVASPREIYSRPATAYVAEFIGQTNLLHAEVLNVVARCGALQWPTTAPDGIALFSLRPESIRAAHDHHSAATIRFRGKVLQQTYAGATELLEIDCGALQVVRARIPASGLITGEREFVFSPDE